MFDEEKQKKLIDKAKEIFGTTESCKRAGYILPDGEMLDFGNPDRKHPDDGIRFQDHTEVWQAYEPFPEIKTLNPEKKGQCFRIDYIDQWLKETGAMRLSATSHYQMHGAMFQPNKPTRKQLETFEYCSCTLRPTENIILEFAKCNKEGKYTPKTFVERVSPDCVEPIQYLNKAIKEWKSDKQAKKLGAWG